MKWNRLIDQRVMYGKRGTHSFAHLFSFNCVSPPSVPPFFFSITLWTWWKLCFAYAEHINKICFHFFTCLVHGVQNHGRVYISIYPHKRTIYTMQFSWIYFNKPTLSYRSQQNAQCLFKCSDQKLRINKTHSISFVFDLRYSSFFSFVGQLSIVDLFIFSFLFSLSKVLQPPSICRARKTTSSKNTSTELWIESKTNHQKKAHATSFHCHLI